MRSSEVLMSFEAMSSNGKYKEKFETEDEKQERDRKVTLDSVNFMLNKISAYLKAYPYPSQFSIQIDLLDENVEIRLRLHKSKELH